VGKKRRKNKWQNAPEFVVLAPEFAFLVIGTC
jgi:hypothetical protein